MSTQMPFIARAGMPSIAPRFNAEVVMKSPKSAPTKRAPSPLKAGVAKQYLDLQELREEVRRAEIRFGIRMHSRKGAMRPEPRSH